MDRFKSMTVFLSIVDTGNFTQAAKQLNIPLASVSYHISNLEKTLGTRLLNRTTRKVTLTDLGRNYANRCRYILSEVQEAENMLNNLKNEPEGELSVNAPISLGNLYLSDFISEFMDLYSQVKINLTLTNELIDVMQSGADIVLRISKPVDSSLLIRKLTPITIIFAASPQYLKNHGEPTSLPQLSQHNCLQYSYSHGQHWKATGPNGIEKTKVKGSLVCNNDETLRIAARDGHGIIYIPSFIINEDLESGHLKQILKPYCEPDYFLYALYPYSRSLSAKTRLFIDFLVDKFSDRHQP